MRYSCRLLDLPAPSMEERLMRTLLAALTLLAAMIAVQPAEAIGRRPPAPTRSVPNRYYQNAANAKAIYPRYYGSTHARQIQNIGIPPGDIGLRGNGVMLTPR